MQRVKGCALFWVHFIAMMKKRFFVASRTKLLILFQLLIPTILLIIVLASLKRAKEEFAKAPKALKLDVNTFGRSIAWLNRLYDTETADSQALHVTEMTKRYFSEVDHPLIDMGDQNINDYYLEQVSLTRVRRLSALKSKIAFVFQHKEYGNKDLFAIAVQNGGYITSWFSIYEKYDIAAESKIAVAVITAENILLKTVSPNHMITVYKQEFPKDETMLRPVI